MALNDQKVLRSTLSAYCALATWTIPALAQSLEPPMEPLEETVVVASRVATPRDTLGMSVSTIDRHDLTVLGYVSLSDILDLQPGVTVSNTGGYGKASTVRVRGEEGFRTRIQLDGIDIADPSSPQISPRVEHLLTEGIQRVEILRGPQGLMYGADGGGVIAISTRPPVTGLSADLNVEFGANNFDRYGVSLAGGSEDMRASLSVSDVGTRGFNARTLDDSDPDSDGYENTTVHGTTEVSLNEQWQFGASIHSVDGRNDYDGCYDTSTFVLINDCRDTYKQTAWRSYTSWRHNDASLTASYEENQIERQFLSADIESFSTDGQHQEFSIIGNTQFQRGQRLTLGIDHLNQSLSDAGQRRQRLNVGIYGEFAQPLFQGNLQIGIRHDDNDDFGRHTSWRLSTYQPLPGLSNSVAVTAAMGTGFRAPSLYEIAYNQGPFAFQPASTTILNAETSYGWEIGIVWEQPDQRIQATYFEQSLDDEIYFDLATYAGYLQRSGENTSSGLELEAQVALTEAWQLSANVTWNETKDANGQQRPYRPELTAATSLQWRSELLEAALTARHASNTVDTLGLPMDDYTLLDLAISVQISSGLALTARVENVSDNSYQQITGYYSAQRAAFIGLRYQH